MEEVKEYESLVATPLKDGEAATILDEERYTTLLRMLQSRDEADHKMAQLVLNTCDIGKSIYWIWQLARLGYTNQMVNLRTKSSRYLRDKSCLFNISGKSPLAFAEFCNKRGWLTSEIYYKLEEKIVDSVHQQFKNTFYAVDFQIKSEYEHLPMNKDVITVKYE